MEDVIDIEALEQSLSNDVVIDEVVSDYTDCISLSKRDCVQFCKLIEPLTKIACDLYGRSVFVKVLDNGLIELCYDNHPARIRHKVQNKVNSQVSSFGIAYATFKKLLSQSQGNLVLVERGGELYFSVCGELIYVETVVLDESLFSIEERECCCTIDRAQAEVAFSRLGSLLELSERSSEKIICVSSDYCTYTTGLFFAKVHSPFSGDESFVLYPQVYEVIQTLCSSSLLDVSYSIHDKTLCLSSEGSYIEFLVGGRDSVNDFISPMLDYSLSFNANCVINSDGLFRLVSVIGALDYLASVIVLEFVSDRLVMHVSSSNYSKQSRFEFPYVEGESVVGMMNISATLFKRVLALFGEGSKICLTQSGLGISANFGKVLLRKV